MIRAVVCAIVFAAGASGQTDTPASLNPPMNERLVLQAHAAGDQVYLCGPDAKNGFAWTLKAPDATLFDSNGKPIGKHVAGPTWQLSDGSSVKAKLTASSPSPDPDSIPWLPLTVTDHQGSGAMHRIVSIQRLHTAGGKAPASGCDAGHNGGTARSHYTADYYFYARAR